MFNPRPPCPSAQSVPVLIYQHCMAVHCRPRRHHRRHHRRRRRPCTIVTPAIAQVRQPRAPALYVASISILACIIAPQAPPSLSSCLCSSLLSLSLSPARALTQPLAPPNSTPLSPLPSPSLSSPQPSPAPDQRLSPRARTGTTHTHHNPPPATCTCDTATSPWPQQPLIFFFLLTCLLSAGWVNPRLRRSPEHTPLLLLPRMSPPKLSKLPRLMRPQPGRPPRPCSPTCRTYLHRHR